MAREEYNEKKFRHVVTVSALGLANRSLHSQGSRAIQGSFYSNEYDDNQLVAKSKFRHH
ncbi:hypothetical protein J45TS6_39640 [Paenibacillus sp. J45TS6]|nr:hypothetical protein J45TS6_39640 [Paenibacillus sp. J45TS6]